MENVIFRERLRPGPGGLALGALGGAVVGALVWPFHEMAGYWLGGLSVLIVVAWLVLSSPVVVVDLGDRELGDGSTWHAGRAHIGVEHLGEVEVLDAGGLRAAMGPDADVRAYVCQRPWVTQGVRVAVVDPRDPAPYWLVASRRPAKLAAALHEAGQAAHSEQTSWPPSS